MTSIQQSVSASRVAYYAPSRGAIAAALPESLREDFLKGHYAKQFTGTTDQDDTAHLWARGYAAHKAVLEAAASPRSTPGGLHQVLQSATEVEWYNGADTSPFALALGSSAQDERALLTFLEGALFSPAHMMLLEKAGAERLREISRITRFGWNNSFDHLESWAVDKDFDTILCVALLFSRHGWADTTLGPRYLEAVRKMQSGARFEDALCFLGSDIDMLEKLADSGVTLEYAAALVDTHLDIS